MEKITRLKVRMMLNTRDPNSNKTTFGHVLIIAGSEGKMGASVIASRASLRAGAGLLSTCIPKVERFILQISLPEAMVVFREEEIDLTKTTVIGIGPGMGLTDESKEVLIHILKKGKVPLVIDADALTLLSEDPSLWKMIPEKTILTPHQGEFDRLFGKHNSQDERLKTAESKAKEYGCIFVMKGPGTVIVSSSKCARNTTGNTGLAKGGTGDALTGVICGFLAQGYDPYVAAQLGVFFHGMSADIAIDSQSEESLLASDVVENFGKAFHKIHAD